MTPRIVLALLLALAALVVGVLGALALSSETTTQENQYRGSRPPAHFELVEFALRGLDGRVVRTSDLAGSVVVLTFIDSQCTESCPLIAWTVARAFDSLTAAERDEVRVIAITTDPAEDTRRAVRSFLARNRAIGSVEYLGGGESPRELRRVWGAFQVLSSLESGEDALHSAPVRIYDGDGVWVSTLHAGADLTEANLANDIRVALGNADG